MDCRTCAFLRVFLMVAGGLLVLIWFTPELSRVYGPIMPTPLLVSLIVPAIGIPMAVVKYVRWKKTGQ